MQTAMTFPNEALFDPRGHLTDAGLRAVTEGTLDELGRLEAAEHLTFCDLCLARYTALVERMPQSLQAPMRDLVPQVQALMRRRSFRVLTNRYFSAVAAVALAFLMWQFGLFGTAAPQLAARPGQPQANVANVQTVLSAFGEGVNDLFDQFQAAAQSGLDKLSGAITLQPPAALPKE